MHNDAQFEDKSGLRIFDKIWAVLLIFLSSPVMMLCVLALWVEGKGEYPIIFKQERLGQYGKPFKILKFRTMIIPGDKSSISKLGRFLRMTHFDELPQFWNMLRGEMTIVGPRPLTEKDCIAWRKKFENFDARFRYVPGAFGPEHVLGREKQQEETANCVEILRREFETYNGMKRRLLEFRYIFLAFGCVWTMKGSPI
jgi:lipopolysaccharide/colanic/teichoic acid biosynthesis glycosyltransferase